jgi:apolipoprotein N-acyltransferase
VRPVHASAAVATGLLLTLAHPPYDAAWLAWVALVPLWLAIADEPPGRAFRLGWLAGTVAHAGILRWTLTTLTTFTTLPVPVAWLAYCALATFLGASTGLFAVGLSWSRWRGDRGVVVGTAWFVVMEWVLRSAPFHYGWAPLGASQHANLALAQTAEIGGVPLLTAVLVLANGTIASALARRCASAMFRVAVVACTVVALYVWGAWRVGSVESLPADGTARIAVVHYDVDERTKWDPEYRERLLAHYGELTRRAAADAPDVVLWPETATPFYLEDDPAGRRYVEALVREVGTSLVLGSPAVVRDASQHVTHFNSVYLIAGDGRIAGRYDKRILVPFGEYVPFGRLLTFVRPIVASGEAMTPGRRTMVFATGRARLGILLCYEGAFASLARDAVDRGADVLVNLSNDGWFARGSGGAQAMALALAKLRAIEQRVPVVRVASGGRSAIVAPSGRIAWSAAEGGPRVHVADIGLHSGRSLYGRAGDVIVWVSMLVVAWSLTLRSPGCVACDSGSDTGARRVAPRPGVRV